METYKIAEMNGSFDIDNKKNDIANTVYKLSRLLLDNSFFAILQSFEASRSQKKALLSSTVGAVSNKMSLNNYIRRDIIIKTMFSNYYQIWKWEWIILQKLYVSIPIVISKTLTNVFELKTGVQVLWYRNENQSPLSKQ